MDATKIAKMFLRNLQSAHRPVHQYRIVEAAGYRHVSQTFYCRVHDEFVTLGFSLLGDIEDVTAAKYGKPNPRTFIRVMVDRDRTTTAGFFHIAPIWFWRIAMWALRIPSKCVDLESRSNDGYWTVTTTAAKKSEQPRPANIIVDYAPRKLTIAQLYERHRQAAAGSGRTFDRIYTLEDAIRLQVEQHARKREHLVSIGWVTPEYIAAMGVPSTMVSSVFAESQRLLCEGFDGSLDS